MEETQEVEKIDLGLGLGLGLGFVDNLRNRSLVPEMTRATQRRDTDYKGQRTTEEGQTGTRSRTHIVHREREVERREGEGRIVEIGSDRRIEVTGVGDDGRERAQIRQIVDAADVGERERAEIAPRRARETEWGLGLGLGAGKRLSRWTLPTYILERGRGAAACGEGAGRWQAGPPAGLPLRSGPCRAGPRAWGKAQARPAPPGHASLGPLAAGPGQKNGPWAGPTGLGCMAIYNFDWQTVGLMHSFRLSGQPGNITRLLSCTDEDLKNYKGHDLAPTHYVPSMSHHPLTGDWYNLLV